MQDASLLQVDSSRRLAVTQITGAASGIGRAVGNMTKNAAMTCVTKRIRVNSIRKGFIDTPLTQVRAADLNVVVIKATPMKRAGKLIEIAHGCLFLASHQSSYITGAERIINGGYLAR